MTQPAIFLSASAPLKAPNTGHALADLATAFKDKGLDVKVAEEVLPHTKGAIVVGLTIAGLTLSAISTIVTVLRYFDSKQPNFSIDLTFEGVPVSASNLRATELSAILEAGKKDVGHFELRVNPVSDP